MSSTLKQSRGYERDENDSEGPPVPGLLLVFSGRMPQWSVVLLEREEQLELGRDSLAAYVQDARISRRHARVFLKGGKLFAEDLGSLNGTSADGQQLAPGASAPLERCLRIGDTIFLASSDVRPLLHSELVSQNGRVIGPNLGRIYLAISQLAQTTSTLHIAGESGVGKEDAARTFHLSTSQKPGPFVAVNCATIAEGIAERLLFGAKRGAFSGADADVPGYIQAAHGGTLFLDEVAELHSAVQAKLLRVLENREVQAVGAVRPTPVDIRVCSASHASLRAQVAAGKLREDLYYRIGRPEIALPPLRERLEELPRLVENALQNMKSAPSPHFSFIESCLLRSWPGNIRELLIEVRAAAHAAIVARSPRIEAKHLALAAGQAIKASAAPAEAEGLPPASASPPAPDSAEDMKRRELEDALCRAGGNISRAARILGMHRNSLTRQLERYGMAHLPGIISGRSPPDTAEKP